MTDIQTWLEAHGLGKYAQAFVAQDIGVDVLSELSDADLKELGVASLGDRKRLLKAVAVGSTPGDAGSLIHPPGTPTAVNAGGKDGSLSDIGTAPMSAAMPAPAHAANAFMGDMALPDAPGSVAVRGSATALPAAARQEEGERRHATVMFSDLTGYTALNEAFDPEEVEAVMGRVKREAIAVIERHGGRVNQFVGDEVMAMFGVPVARRDDPQRAVRAALELHQAVDAIAQGLQAKLGRLLSMHTGVQSGLVVARRSDSRSGDYTLTGDTVNTAARLRGLAKPGELVVSPQVWQQVSDYFEGEAGQAVEVKGKERPLVPWRIVKERAVHRAGSRPLVGRAEEMQQFATLLQACRQRQRGRVVFVRGDPGMGKSRLVAEFLHLAREQGMECHNTAIADFGARTGRDAIRRLAQSLLGLPLDADVASRCEAISAFASSPGGEPHAPFLYDMLDAAAPARVLALLSAIDVPTRDRASLDALCALVQPDQTDQPMLLLIEDIHWAGAFTLKQLGALAALTTKQPLILVLTTRFAGDPSIGPWRSTLHGLPVSSIDLGPLAAQDALQLAAGAASISEALLRSCVERAEGNPLFLEQLLLNAGDEGAGNLPGSIQALIQARMDRLSLADKNALQAASVLGSRMQLAALRHLLGDPAFDARALIEQFLLRPDGEDLEFSHALIRDGAYGSLLHARRRQLHLLAAQWIEPHDVALAAEHYELAQDTRAARAYLRAAQSLAEGFKFAEALARVERGAALDADGQTRFDLSLTRARLLLDNLRVLDAVQEAEKARHAAVSDAGRALALIVSASGMRLLDRLAEGLDLLDQALPLAEQAGMGLELSRLHHLRGNLLFGLGRIEPCLAAHELALRYARQVQSVEDEAAALGGIGDATYAQGKVRTAHGMFTQCVAMARQHGLLRVEVSYLTMMGWTSLYLMDVKASLEASSSAIELARRVAHKRTEMMAHAQRAMSQGWTLGQIPQAHAHLDRALEIVQSLGSVRFEAMNWTFRAILSVRAGDMQAAREQVAKAFALAGDIGRRFVGIQLYGVLAWAQRGAAARDKALQEGEALLDQGSLSLGAYLFFDLVIDATLGQGQWEQAERLCARFESYTAHEPFDLAVYAVARGRALCRAGRGERGPELLGQLQALRERAQQTQSLVFLPALDAAIAGMAL